MTVARQRAKLTDGMLPGTGDLAKFVAVDVEISSKRPLTVCALGATRIEMGKETGTFYSLVRAPPPIRFGHIHGLRAQDLARADEWPTVWAAFLDLLGEIRVAVAFRAAFDRGALIAACGSHGTRMPHIRFVCAATMAKAKLGHDLDLATNLQTLGLTYPGTPHHALADARAAALLATNLMDRAETIQFSKNAAPIE